MPPSPAGHEHRSTSVHIGPSTVSSAGIKHARWPSNIVDSLANDNTQQAPLANGNTQRPVSIHGGMEPQGHGKERRCTEARSRRAGYEDTSLEPAAYIVMADIVMACIAMAYISMAYIVMACIVMAYIIMAYIVVAEARSRGARYEDTSLEAIGHIPANNMHSYPIWHV